MLYTVKPPKGISRFFSVNTATRKGGARYIILAQRKNNNKLLAKNQFNSVQSLSHLQLFVTPWAAV